VKDKYGEGAEQEDSSPSESEDEEAAVQTMVVMETQVVVLSVIRE
jgi:hypothetical protein